jgi:type VI secretion system secreted protein Hcp
MAIDMFLKIDGIPGESTNSAHRDEIDVVSYDWAESQSGSPVGGGGGGGGGKVTMQDFRFAMHVNKASPKLFLACAMGTHIRNATLTVRRSGDNPIEFLKWTFTDVVVASYETGASVVLGELPIDQISLAFAKIETEYTPITGAGGVVVKAGWDLRANAPT